MQPWKLALEFTSQAQQLAIMHQCHLRLQLQPFFSQVETRQWHHSHQDCLPTFKDVVESCTSLQTRPHNQYIAVGQVPKYTQIQFVTKRLHIPDDGVVIDCCPRVQPIRIHHQVYQVCLQELLRSSHQAANNVTRRNLGVSWYNLRKIAICSTKLTVCPWK